MASVSTKKIGLGCQGKLGTFIEKYVVCEATANKLAQFYKTDKKLKAGGILRKDELANSLKFFGIKVTQRDINTVFAGGSGKRGSKSARQIRNGFLHSISDSDRKEIEKEYSRLTGVPTLQTK